MGILNKLTSIFKQETMDYREKINNGAVVVDVRSKEEFKSGNAKGSMNVPLQTIGAHVEKLKDKEVILVCMSGGRAGSAKGLLERNGITAHNAGAWQNVSYN